MVPTEGFLNRNNAILGGGAISSLQYCAIIKYHNIRFAKLGGLLCRVVPEGLK